MLGLFIISASCLVSLTNSAAPRFHSVGENVDICSLPPSYFSGINCVSPIDVWTFNALTNSCHQILKGGCLGTGNMFESQSECQTQCGGHTEIAPRVKRNVSKCNQPQAQGHCRAYFDRYYYNPYSRQCEPFIYTGCGGNENNFVSFRDCQRSCRSW